MSGDLLRFGSVCSGIEAASAAWLPLGWRAAFLSETAAFPRSVLAHHYPETPLHGDFTTIQAGDYDPIDVLVGGTPCQSFSVAGLRGGLEDARGNLALEYLRLADRLRPRWLVWENVPGVRSSNGGRDFGAFLGGLGKLGYGWAYRSLDAQHFGLAQRRERVFVVGHLGDWRRAAAVLFEPASLRGDSAPRREKAEGVARPITPGSPGGSGYRNDADTADNLISHTLSAARGTACAHAADPETYIPVAHALAARMGRSRGAACVDEPALVAFGGNNTAGAIDVATAVNAHGGPHGRLDFESETFVTHAFDCKAGGKTGLSIGDIPGALRGEGHGGGHAAVQARAAVRRLTPRECERLMGFPDDFTAICYRGKPAADGPRYKALGNSMAVPCMGWIGRRIGETTHVG